ncbi:hypothetical protein ACS49_01665 [Bacillus cereus]|nr:hypothetical protein ACS49_01665 [Bacillus cereus]
MKVSRKVRIYDREADGSKAKRHHLNWMSILRGETKWCRVSVVLFVDIFVKRTVMEQSVSPVMPEILEHKEQTKLEAHFCPRRKWDCDTNA